MTNEEKIAHLCAALESAVDLSSAHEVLACLATVCEAKSEHVATNWQDYELAKAWLRVGNICLETAKTVKGVLP